jgi:hypothetical protein
MVGERGSGPIRPRSRLDAWRLVLGVVTFHLLCGSAFAQISGQASLGFGGLTVAGCWNPVTLKVTNHGPAFEGVVRAHVPGRSPPDDPWSRGDVYTLPATFPQGTTTLRFVVQPVESYYGLRVEVLRGKEVVFRQVTNPVWDAHRGGLTLVFVTPAQQEAESVRDRPFSALPRTGTEFLLTPAEAPTDPRAYDPAYSVVLGDIALGHLPPAAWDAIRRWTAGGRLLVLTAPFLARNAASPEVSQFAGVTVLGRRPPSGLADALTLFSRKPIRGAPTQVLDVRVSASEVLASAGGHVLAFEHPVGVGAVRGFTVDPAWSDIPDWPSRTRLRDGFWAKALRGTAGVPVSPGSTPWSMVPAHSRLSNTGLPLFIVLLVFVAVAGPLNCAVVGVMRKKELVVITTPAIVLVFVVGLLVAGLIVHSPFPILVHQTANVTSVGTPGVSSLGAFGVFSPGTRSYELTFGRPQPAFRELATPGSGLPPGARSSLVVSVGEPAALSNVQVERWSMRAFEESTFVPQGTVEGELAIGPEGLSGAATNRLPIALRDCYLIHKWNHVAVGELAPGARKPLALKLGPPSVSDYQLSRLQNLPSPGSWLDQTLWPLRPETRQWEQVGESICRLTRAVSGPFLLGWGEPLLRAPELRGRHGTGGAHLYVAPLRTTIGGPDLTVPVGGAFETTGNSRSGWLATYSAHDRDGEVPGGGAPGGMPGVGPPYEGPGTHELLLPIEGARPQHQRLAIHGQLPPHAGGGGMGPTAISLYDWERQRWKALTREADPTFSLEVPEPGRFILWPPGLVRVATGAWDASGKTVGHSYGIAWVDVEYAGRGGAR